MGKYIHVYTVQYIYTPTHTREHLQVLGQKCEASLLCRKSTVKIEPSGLHVLINVKLIFL